MIKVIASDMDGTLLGNDHKVAPETLSAIQAACDAGIRFMIVTGRNFPGAMTELEGLDLTCDYVVGGGAEVRTPDKKVVKQTPLAVEQCRKIYEELKEFPISVIVCTDGYDYRIGTEEESEESIIRQIQLFHTNQCRDEIIDGELYRHIKENTKIIPSLDELEEKGIPVYKIFLFTGDLEMLDRIKRRLQNNKEIAVTSSFETNLEITDIKAQKGPVLKEYAESLGYQMDEIMVFGDNLNDYSMLSMDFGATIAMGNGVPEVKKAAKYVTKTNEEHGVAYAVRELLKRRKETGDGEHLCDVGYPRDGGTAEGDA